MRRAYFLAAVLAAVLVSSGRRAHANDYLHYGSGPAKNLYVDLVFWGTNFQDSDRQNVLAYVNQVTSWMNGGPANGTPPPAGLEPAVHLYGLSGITPGSWVNYKSPIPVNYWKGGGNQLDDAQFQPIVNLSHSLTPVYDFNSNVVNATGLPASSNHLILVITKNTNDYCISAHRAFGCVDSIGYHDTMSSQPYGAVMIETPVDLSHEIMESMTDAYVFKGWTASNGLFSTN